MNECDIIQRALNAIEVEAQGVADATEQYVDNKVQADPDHPRFASSPVQQFIIKMSKALDITDKKKRMQKINELRGTLSTRQALALEIRTLIEANPHLAKAIVEELHLDAVALGSRMDLKLFKTNEDGSKTLMLHKLPAKTLKKHQRFVHAWVNADGGKWDSLYYKAFRLGWGTTRKLRFTENSGAYHTVWKAAQDFADNIAGHIDKFMSPEETFEKVKITHKGKEFVRDPRKKDMSIILNEVEGVYEEIPIDKRNAWESVGYFGERSKELGRDKIMELFTWMMHGRVENVTEEHAKKTDKNGKLIYEQGAGWYINTWWAPTSNRHKNGDVIFGWQKPVPLKYNKDIHGDESNMKLTDQKGRDRYDTLDLIRSLPPLTDTSMDKLANRATRARQIMDEAYVHFEKETEKSFMNVLNSLMKHFPDKTINQIRNAIVDGEFYDESGRKVWTPEDQKKLQFLEENFTKWSLEKPFQATMQIAKYKKFYFPYIYMPEKFVFLIEDAIDSMEYSLEQVRAAQSGATGEALVALENKEDALVQSIQSQRDMKEALLTTDKDVTDGDLMLTRSKAKHFKHISNAFDVLNSRVDRGVFRSYLEHMGRSVERNNLTAALINGLSMTEVQPVRDAFLSLYKATMGREDARSLVLGMDISDENFNPRTVRGFKATRKYLNLMLSGPMTALRQGFGLFEKINKSGWAGLQESIDYLKLHETELASILQESGVTLFNEFFTNSIVKELESMEASRDVINKMLQTYLQYFNARNKGKSEKAAVQELKIKLTKLFGSELKWENVLSEEEAKNFNKKMKAEKIQRITNKITVYAINNESGFRKLVGEEPALLKVGAVAESGLIKFRNVLGRVGVMGQMEMWIRSTSFVLGVLNAQKVGAVKSGNIWELEGREREIAIYYGRKATNVMYDFSMSRQGVGEVYRSSLGSLLGQFSVWKTQKFASDLDLWKNAVQTMDSEYVPIRVLEVLREVWRPDEALAKTNPDALNLKRWLRTQFMIEGVIQLLYVVPIMPDIIRHVAYLAGARHLGGAGSPLAALIWAPILMLLALTVDDDDPWDDAKDVEKFIAYHIRALPGVGTGIGFGYDLMALFMLLLMEEEKAAAFKAKGMASFVLPEPISRSVLKETPALIEKAIK